MSKLNPRTYKRLLYPQSLSLHRQSVLPKGSTHKRMQESIGFCCKYSSYRHEHLPQSSNQIESAQWPTHADSPGLLQSTNPSWHLAQVVSNPSTPTHKAQCGKKVAPFMSPVALNHRYFSSFLGAHDQHTLHRITRQNLRCRKVKVRGWGYPPPLPILYATNE